MNDVVSPAEAVPQINLFKSTATAARGFMVPQPVFKGGVFGFVAHWLIALGPTPFVFLASGVFVLGRVVKSRASPSVAPGGVSASAGAIDPSGKDRKSNVQRDEEADTSDQLVRARRRIVANRNNKRVTCWCYLTCLRVALRNRGKMAGGGVDRRVTMLPVRQLCQDPGAGLLSELSLLRVRVLLRRVCS